MALDLRSKATAAAYAGAFVKAWAETVTTERRRWAAAIEFCAANDLGDFVGIIAERDLSAVSTVVGHA
ncbi:hypothetical protein [Bauldia litoralis]|uniref:hypothetical protein n=1 Tax=Bauldia litoralis TaxID=665467 RepID=UPI003264D742